MCIFRSQHIHMLHICSSRFVHAVHAHSLSCLQALSDELRHALSHLSRWRSQQPLRVACTGQGLPAAIAPAPSAPPASLWGRAQDSPGDGPQGMEQEMRVPVADVLRMLCEGCWAEVRLRGCRQVWARAGDADSWEGPCCTPAAPLLQPYPRCTLACTLLHPCTPRRCPQQ